MVVYSIKFYFEKNAVFNLLKIAQVPNILSSSAISNIDYNSEY